MGQQNSYLTVIGVHNWDAFDHVSHTPYLLLDNYCVCVFGCVCMHAFCVCVCVAPWTSC